MERSEILGSLDLDVDLDRASKFINTTTKGEGMLRSTSTKGKGMRRATARSGSSTLVSFQFSYGSPGLRGPVGESTSTQAMGVGRYCKIVATISLAANL